MNSNLISLINMAIGEESRNNFCKRAGISAGNLSRIMRGQRPSPDVLECIANCTQATVTYRQLMEAAGYIDEEMDDIAIIGAVAAGSPIEAVENIEGYISLNYNCSGAAKGSFALKVVGDSMDAAGIPDGSVVVVRPQSKLEEGEIGAFRVNGEVTVKRGYISNKRIMLMPVSHNSEHFPQVYTEEDDISLLGKVVMVLIDLE